MALLSSGEPANSSTLYGALAPLGLEAVDEGLRLELADLEVVERRVVVDGVGVADQAVVGDDRDVLVSLAVCEHVAERRAVDRGDDEHLGALGDHVLDLGDLGRDVVLGVLQVDLVAGGLELLLDVVAVGDPALRRLRGHGDADGALVAAAAGAAVVAAASREARAPERPAGD